MLSISPFDICVFVHAILIADGSTVIVAALVVFPYIVEELISLSDG